MNKLKFTTFTAAFGLAIAFTLSCSSEGGGGGNGTTIKKSSITGVSQKGPFVKGTKATLYELDENFTQTSRSFFDIIADDRGSFEIKDVELASPYALLEADGFYRNEVTGKVSAAPIKLYAIADIREKDNININLITHLEYYRVQALALAGKSIAEAKKQAQREILAVFDIGGDFIDSEDMSIFGTTEGDAALLAISVLLQGSLSEGEFSQRLADFAQSLKANGTWTNEAAKTAMADWAAGADLDDIKENVLAWGLSSEVPGFGKYAYAYWTDSYGMGMCDEAMKWELKKPSNENSIKKDSLFVCEYGSWKQAGKSHIFCSENPCLIDDRDGQRYMYETFDGFTVMRENLNYSRGNTLGYCYGVDVGGENPHRDGKGCYNGYGRVYEWEVAMDGTNGQGLCPSGWHLPNRSGKGYTPPIENPWHYNLDTRYPPIGWKLGTTLYWTSEKDYFIASGQIVHDSAKAFLSVYCIKD